jgi:hypothetical protein
VSQADSLSSTSQTVFTPLPILDFKSHTYGIPLPG